MMKTFHSRTGSKVLLGTIVSLAVIGLYLVLSVTRVDPDQQMAQKIFYYHVPSAWTTFLAYFLVMVGGIQYLRTGDEKWDRFGLAAAEIGSLFCALVLVTGPIWAKPIWGTAWNWEPRLTTTLILFLIYVGYFMLRQFGGTPERVRRLAAVVGILAFVDVPIVYVSVKLWAPEVQSHPQPEMAAQPGDVLGTFFLSLTMFTLLLAYMMRYRIHVLSLQSALLEESHGL
ncbi:MAG: cytochrome c biogenesis protein, partial [Fidelibacterota bacterium]